MLVNQALVVIAINKDGIAVGHVDRPLDRNHERITLLFNSNNKVVNTWLQVVAQRVCVKRRFARIGNIDVSIKLHRF